MTIHVFRRNGFFILSAGLVVILFAVFILIIRSDIKTEKNLTHSLAESRLRLQHLETMYRSVQKEVASLSQYLNLGATTSNTTTRDSETFNLEQPKTSSENIVLPSAYRFLVKPEFVLSKARTGVSIVLGIPTVKRAKQNYLINTLESLISNMNEGERNDTLIVVFVAETDLEYVHEIAKEIQLTFSEHCDSGLIEVISPPASYYPDMKMLRRTLKDSVDRVKWRSKQNLDYAFLMAYCQFKATFFVQLEDDILTKAGFISTMNQFAVAKTATQGLNSWIVADFCQLGFIGKMFKSAELPWLITFLQVFFNDEPTDWLLEDLIQMKVCNREKDMRLCKPKIDKVWLRYKPSLFQHIGTASSLAGKSQWLKDRSFGHVPEFYPHKNNPSATVWTQLKPYKDKTLMKAYKGDSSFWGTKPQTGDAITFTFNQPSVIKEFRFRSGSPGNPSDKFYNTTVEVLPDQLDVASFLWQKYNKTIDGYLVVGNFNQFGLAEGHLDTRIGKLRELRLQVHSDSDNNVILSEIFLQSDRTSYLILRIGFLLAFVAATVVLIRMRLSRQRRFLPYENKSNLSNHLLGLCFI